MKSCRGIVITLIVVAGMNLSRSESLSWQYGKSLSQAPDTFAEAEPTAPAVPSLQEAAALPPAPVPETKPSGVDPKPSSSKVTLQISSLLDAQWGMLKNPGLNLKEAWNVLVSRKVVKPARAFSCAFSPITIAIIDTGVDFSHRNLKDVAWTNIRELRGKKGVDDDHNGFVDDVNGWDFTSNSPLIVDGHGHGTHLAGIISGNSEEPNGFKGVCPGIKIMSLRYFATDMTGLKNLENTVKAIKYATKNGANIINYSGGGASYAHDEYMALKEATNKGILIVAAAGNERSDTARRPYFPASYDLPNIVAVAGIGEDGKLIPASNWGKTTVDVAAPGGAILSLQQNQTYGFMNGTSQATAFVSGLAGLVWSVNPKLKAAEVKTILERSVAKNKYLKTRVASEGQVDAGLAMKMVLEYKSFRNQLKKAAPPRVLTGTQPGKPTASLNE